LPPPRRPALPELVPRPAGRCAGRAVVEHGRAEEAGRRQVAQMKRCKLRPITTRVTAEHIGHFGNTGRAQPLSAADAARKGQIQVPVDTQCERRAAARFGMLDCNRSKSLLSRLTLKILVALACVTVGHGQTAVEYALKSSGSAVSGHAADATVGGCKVDSTLLTCLSRSYPKIMIMVAGLLAVLIMRQLTRAHSTRP